MKVAVVSGKGGVGKTTITLAMAETLARRYKVGIFDADVTGANTHLQLKIIKDFEIIGETIYPAIAELNGHKIEYMSIALVSDSYVLWKGDSVGDFVSQIMEKTKWSCDYVIIDAPPGTHADMLKAVECSDVVVLVTIPAKFAELDAVRTIELVREIGKPIAGMFINFTHVVCPHCGKEIKLFDYGIDLPIPVIDKIRFGSVSIDLDKLVYHLNNPVMLKPRGEKLSVKAKRELVKLILKGFARGWR